MKQRILKWMCAIGQNPYELIGLDKGLLLQRFKSRYELKIEELQEQLEALEEGNFVEFLDGILDEYVYLSQDMVELEALGFKVNEAFDAVLDNNETKLTTSEDYILIQHALKVKDAGENNWYVDANVFNDETYYCLKNHSNDKVAKFIDHEKPDISQFVPISLQNLTQAESDTRLPSTGNVS